MFDSVEYATLLQYSPRGKAQVSVRSQKVTGAIKGGRLEKYKARIIEIISENQNTLGPFLNQDVTLVPAPRSSPIRDFDLWPSLEIAKLLEAFKLGKVSTCLFRSHAIKKSSLCHGADDRPSITEQYNSLAVKDDVPSANITIIDDVLTLGRTSFSGAWRLSDKFPNATIRVFSLIRTRGLGENTIDQILNVQMGNITYNSVSGRCKIHDP